MNKFKVGDKVKFVGDYRKHITNYKGESLENFIKRNRNILCIDSIRSTYINVKEDNFWCFKETELELIKEYTFEDLKKAPIGTKIVFEKLKDEPLIKISENEFKNEKYIYYIRRFKDFNTIGFGKITKIEEPTYTTVYESKVEILDEVEKRYLSIVIRPFRDRVKTISKFVYSGGNASIDISIDDNNTGWLIELLHFPKNEMYKGMEDNKKYTIEELGL